MQRPLPNIRRPAGFTVVEVMMAAVILLVGFIGLIEAVALSTNFMEHARRQSLATQILNHEIEELYLASWSTISGLSTGSTSITIDSRFDEARQALGDDLTSGAVVRFTLRRTVTDPDPATDIREVNFTVTWAVKTSRRLSGSSLLKFTHTRSSSAWYGRFGLLHSYQQS